WESASFATRRPGVRIPSRPPLFLNRLFGIAKVCQVCHLRPPLLPVGGLAAYNGSDNVVINNIFQHMPTTMQQEGCSGCVDAYNFTVDQNYTADPQWQINSSRHHSVGDAFILHEGNVGNGYMADDVHGTSNFATSFRNYWNGRE